MVQTFAILVLYHFAEWIMNIPFWGYVVQESQFNKSHVDEINLLLFDFKPVIGLCFPMYVVNMPFIDFHLQYLLSLADDLKPSFLKVWCNTGLFVNSSLNASKDKRNSSL